MFAAGGRLIGRAGLSGGGADVDGLSRGRVGQPRSWPGWSPTSDRPRKRGPCRTASSVLVTTLMGRPFSGSMTAAL